MNRAFSSSCSGLGPQFGDAVRNINPFQPLVGHRCRDVWLHLLLANRDAVGLRVAHVFICNQLGEAFVASVRECLHG